MKKRLPALLSTVMVISMGAVSSFATGNDLKSETVSSTQFTASRLTISPEKQRILDQFLQEKAAGKKSDLKLGETEEVYRDRNGGTMYVTVTDEGESFVCEANRSYSENYIFPYKITMKE